MAQAEPGPAEASAQVAAESTFAEGVRLMKEDRCEEAIEKFRASELLEPASGTRLNLAYCEVKLGRIASAWFSYRRAITLAEQNNKPLHEQIAREQAAKLEADLPRLSINVPGGPQRSLTVELDGKVVPRETWGVSVPVDPGPHRIAAVLEDGSSWDTTVNLALTEHTVAELPPMPTLPAAPPPSDQAPLKPARRPPPDPSPEQRTRVDRPQWALAVTAVGAATVAAGGALFVSARVRYDDARHSCDAQNQCDDASYDAERAARHRAEVSGLLVGSGAILACGGVIAYFTLGKTSGGARVTLTGAVGPKQWLGAVRGQF